ncbi:hypothetical protein FOT98_08950 [Bacillus sp. HY001]|uniref:hypothetical protein n=1 Tax=Bacillus TaxID=1386 RepID=UPI001185A72B|nr:MULTISPECIES: hypothetical protein [Bacillus]TSI19910.1 hypothetical protein FOT98_08950 [Bacillus sp. HY001]
MAKFEFKQEVKCNCGCDRVLGIVLGKMKSPGMWAIAEENGIAFVNEKKMVGVDSEVKGPAAETVKIPKEIAAILDLKEYSSSPNGMWEVLDKHAHKLFETPWLFEKGNLIKLARAIEDGYEVEEPEIKKGDYVVFENKQVKWIAKCCGIKEKKLQFEYAIEFKLGKYDYDNGGEVPMYMFDVRIATEEEVKEFRRAAAFIKNNRKLNQFKPYDIATDKNGSLVRVEKESDANGEVIVFYGNEEDEYLAVSRPAAELTLRYIAEDRVDLED